VTRRLFRDAGRLGLPPRGIVMLLLFQLGGTAMELAGLAALVPVVQYVQAGGDVAGLVAQQRLWAILAEASAVTGIPLSLETLLGASMVALLLRQGFVFLRLRHQVRIREGLLAQNRARGFAAYVRADAAYHDAQSPGRVVNDLTTELDRAVQYLFSGVMLTGLAVIFAAYLAVMLAVAAALTAVAMVVFGVAAVAMRGQLKKTVVVSREIVEANRNTSAFLVERLKLARLIRLAGTEAVEAREMARLTDRQRSRMVRIFNLLANLEIIVEPIVVGAALLVFYVSVSVFAMPLEYVGLFLLLVMRLLPVLKETARTRQTMRGTEASFRHVAERLEEMEAAREVPGGTRPFPGLAEGLRFEGVSFAYPSRPDHPVLDRVTLTVPAGGLTAIVGPSGAGKSTLFDLIPRLRRPTAGRILADGTDIAEFNLASLRRGIAYAPQSPQVFNVPLIEHIRYGKPDATEEEVRRAAGLANAAGFIEALPEGYATLAGEGGGRLSGGQRQRLDLARALVAQAPILLLDEPTSNLDADSEALFRDALLRIRNHTSITVIVIAHRLSTVTLADKIVVMEGGRVVDEGRHEDLLGAGGWYAEAFVKQGGDLQAAERLAAQ
jgi:subfamily B ATP-binding cassette protein MsbA